MDKYVIALYIRLSIEDEKYDSMSIENQQLILREKAMQLPEWSRAEVREYIDNGHSGTNFERPAMQELLSMVQAGKINCIMVKDLSRFGRNSIETGYFIERVFPLYHVRFIAVGDNYDSDKYKGTTGGIEVAFKYLINEAYSRDMSVKTRSAKYAKMRRGEYQSVSCPYGYQKGADGRMEPNPETAPTVRQIFQWAAEGNSSADIARKLYKQHIPTPGEYRAAAYHWNYPIDRVNGVWSTSTVLRILSDERYIGSYVIGKYTVREIGSSRVRRKSESEWFKIPGHHEPIVDAELFAHANATIYHWKSTNKKQHDYPLKGKVFCGYCGHGLSRKGKGEHIVYYCRHSSGLPDFTCCKMEVSAKKLEETVLQTIRTQVAVIGGVDLDSDTIQLSSTELAEQEKKLNALKESKRQLYEQYIRKEITMEEFQTQKSEVDLVIQMVESILDEMRKSTDQLVAKYEEEARLKKLAQAAKSPEGLSLELADRMVNKVQVFHDNRIKIESSLQDAFSEMNHDT